MDSRGQTTFEYLLLVGGVVMLAVLIIWMLTTGVESSSRNVNATIGSATNTMITEANTLIDRIGKTVK